MGMQANVEGGEWCNGKDNKTERLEDRKEEKKRCVCKKAWLPLDIEEKNHTIMYRVRRASIWSRNAARNLATNNEHWCTRLWDNHAHVI